MATTRSRTKRNRYIAVAVDSYEGDDTWLQADPRPMFVVVAVQGTRTAVVDYGYRSLRELKAAWPKVDTTKAEG
jgi:hypothetical protein